MNKTQDVVKEGQKVKVKVKVKLMGFDDRGKVRLSMRVVDQETGEDLEGKEQAAERYAPLSVFASGAKQPSRSTRSPAFGPASRLANDGHT